jgi:hypothetical protein
MKVSTEIDNNFGYEKITQLVDNIPLKHRYKGIGPPFFEILFFSFGVFFLRVWLITLTYYPVQFSIHIIFGYYIDSNQILCE